MIRVEVELSVPLDGNGADVTLATVSALTAHLDDWLRNQHQGAVVHRVMVEQADA